LDQEGLRVERLHAHIAVNVNEEVLHFKAVSLGFAHDDVVGVVLEFLFDCEEFFDVFDAVVNADLELPELCGEFLLLLFLLHAVHHELLLDVVQHVLKRNIDVQLHPHVEPHLGGLGYRQQLQVYLQWHHLCFRIKYQNFVC